VIDVGSNTAALLLPYRCSTAALLHLYARVGVIDVGSIAGVFARVRCAAGAVIWTYLEMLLGVRKAVVKQQ